MEWMSFAIQGGFTLAGLILAAFIFRRKNEAETKSLKADASKTEIEAIRGLMDEQRDLFKERLEFQRQDIERLQRQNQELTQKVFALETALRAVQQSPTPMPVLPPRIDNG